MDKRMPLGYRGTVRTILTPDTLDLSVNAALALNGLAGTIDPMLHHHLYFHADFCTNPAYMNHYASDYTLDAKYAESFPMMRLMSGSDQFSDIEDAQRAELISRIEDGLYWCFYDPAMKWRGLYCKGFDGKEHKEDYANVLATARMMRAVLTWMDVDADPRLERCAQGLADGLCRVQVRRPGYRFYPDAGFGEPFNYPRSGWTHEREALSDTDGGEGNVVGYQGNQIQVLAKWFARTGDEKYLKAAEGVARYCMLPRFWGGMPDPNRGIPGHEEWQAAALPDQACVAGSELGHFHTHFHMRAVGLRGILEYGLAANDWHAIQFVKRALEYAMTMAIPRLGWFNCYPAGRNAMEGCALGDLAALYVKLSDAGAGDYWDDLDALARNALDEAQLKDKAQLESIVATSGPYVRSGDGDYHRLFENQFTTDRVIERSIGTFASVFTPNSNPKLWVMQCCTGNATEGLYYAWEAILREDAGEATVNLLLNRAGRTVDVLSWLPFEGKAEVRVHGDAHTVKLRVPGWVDTRRVITLLNGNAVSPIAVGRYRVFEGLKPGDTVTLLFDVPQSRASYTVNSGTRDQAVYECAFRGSTALNVTPEDSDPQSYVFYRREHMACKQQADFVERSFYVSERVVRNW